MVLAQKAIIQINGTECPKMNPCTDGQLIHDKGGKTIQWRKDSLVNNWLWKNWTTPCKSVKLEHYLIP